MKYVAATTLSLAAAAPVLAQQSQSLDQAANDPTASILSLQIQDAYSGEYHLLDDASSNSIILRPVLPFEAFGQKHIARATLPFFTRSPSGKHGFSDLVLFDLIVFDKDWGRWGLGPVALFPTAEHEALGAEKWAIGPAIGFTARSEKLLWGLFNQNLITYAGEDDREDVNLSVLQPIVNYSLPHKWSIGSSEMNISYDWENSRWSSLPLGIKLSKLIKPGRIPIQLSGFYEYNFRDDLVGPEWTVNFTAKFLIPVKGQQGESP